MIRHLVNIKGLLPFGDSIDISDFISIYYLEDFQKKSFTKQLDLLLKRYPSANHTRLEHMLGTLQLLRELIKGIESNTYKPNYMFTEQQKRTLEVAALIHDVGHPGFSHGTEEILMSMQKGPRNQRVDHNVKTIDFIKKNKEAFQSIELIDYELLLKLFQGDPMYQIIGSIIGADKLDYVNRDALSCGEEIHSDIKTIISNAYFDGEHYGLIYNNDSFTAAIGHISNWLQMHRKVYLQEIGNTTKGLIRRGLYELIKNNKTTIDDIWDFNDNDIMAHLFSFEGTKWVYDILNGKPIPETFLAFKLENQSGFEDSHDYKRIYSKLNKNELMKLASYLTNNIENVIKFEDELSEKLGFRVIVSELPHIRRLNSYKEVYLMNDDWIKLSDVMPKYKIDEFTYHSEQIYALRFCVEPVNRREAFEQSDKVINCVNELINQIPINLESYLSI